VELAVEIEKAIWALETAKNESEIAIVEEKIKKLSIEVAAINDNITASAIESAITTIADDCGVIVTRAMTEALASKNEDDIIGIMESLALAANSIKAVADSILKTKCATVFVAMKIAGEIVEFSEAFTTALQMWGMEASYGILAVEAIPEAAIFIKERLKTDHKKTVIAQNDLGGQSLAEEKALEIAISIAAILAKTIREDEYVTNAISNVILKITATDPSMHIALADELIRAIKKLLATEGLTMSEAMYEAQSEREAEDIANSNNICVLCGKFEGSVPFMVVRVGRLSNEHQEIVINSVKQELIARDNLPTFHAYCTGEDQLKNELTDNTHGKTYDDVSDATQIEKIVAAHKNGFCADEMMDWLHKSVNFSDDKQSVFADNLLPIAKSIPITSADPVDENDVFGSLEWCIRREDKFLKNANEVKFQLFFDRQDKTLSPVQQEIRDTYIRTAERIRELYGYEDKIDSNESASTGKNRSLSELNPEQEAEKGQDTSQSGEQNTPQDLTKKQPIPTLDPPPPEKAKCKKSQSKGTRKKPSKYEILTQAYLDKVVDEIREASENRRTFLQAKAASLTAMDIAEAIKDSFKAKIESVEKRVGKTKAWKNKDETLNPVMQSFYNTRTFNDRQNTNRPFREVQ
jgi:hypothetical protein